MTVMKLISRFFISLSLLFILTTCRNNYDDFNYYGDYVPVLMDRDVMEASVHFDSSQPIKETGKIYVQGNYIFISEKYQGIHIIDNRNPSNPVKAGFFRVPGCVDMAIKNNVLYVDNAVDLVAIDFDSTNWSNSKVSSRIKDVFPELSPPVQSYIPWEFTKESRPKNTIIIGWKLKQ
jgi:hypothetical protein